MLVSLICNNKWYKFASDPTQNLQLQIVCKLSNNLTDWLNYEVDPEAQIGRGPQIFWLIDRVTEPCTWAYEHLNENDLSFEAKKWPLYFKMYLWCIKQRPYFGLQKGSRRQLEIMLYLILCRLWADRIMSLIQSNKLWPKPWN